MDTLQGRLTPKAAVEAGFKEFRGLFAGQRATHVLLEGLELFAEDDLWRVVIGFDTGRSKETGSAFALHGLGPRTLEPIRELRAILIDAKTGALVRMEGA